MASRVICVRNVELIANCFMLKKNFYVYLTVKIHLHIIFDKNKLTGKTSFICKGSYFVVLAANHRQNLRHLTSIGCLF